jgi:hypothetical protein
VKTRHIVMTARPVTGRVAFVRAGAMRSPGACNASAHPLLPASYHKLGRDEGSLNPGEEGA